MPALNRDAVFPNLGARRARQAMCHRQAVIDDNGASMALVMGPRERDPPHGRAP